MAIFALSLLAKFLLKMLEQRNKHERGVSQQNLR